MTSVSASTDGSFSLFYQKGWAWLAIRAPEGKGKPVYPEEIENRMRLLRIPKVPMRILRERIEAAAGSPERLVEWPDGDLLTAAIHVSVDETAMTARLTVDTPKKGAAPPTADEIDEALRRYNVVYGIDRSAIARIVTYQDYGRTMVIARGTSPVHGEGSKIVYHFNVNRGKPYLEMDFGRIDLKELNFIENKHEGDILAELAPPVRAVNGRTVTGVSIPARPAGENVCLIAGQNTSLNEERNKIFAACEGNAKISPTGEISVEPIVTVENVNYETGNIHFNGSVVIKGSIADGFTVEAGGDIQVGKGVGKAALKAAGNILLKTGITGNTDGSVECGGNLFAKYIESSRVVCHGHLFVEEAIMHSQITVWKNCVLNGRRSELIGGAALVGGSLWCKKLGNLYEVPTYVAAATRPSLFLAYREAQKKLAAKEAELDAGETHLAQFEKAMQEGHGDDEKILQAKTQTEALVSNLNADIAGLRHELPGLREELVAERGRILVAEDIIYRGVTIVFGKLEFHVPDNGSRKTILRAGEHEIIESGYNFKERPKLEFGDE
ncbi:MAG: FapA family protein [Spirochaetales bacterium]|jgi:uncharacterized protein (DUF342 family)|nr:FapA family protein [Spirochaetales bacterium]